MSNLILVFICLLIGQILKYVKHFPQNASQVLNAYVIYVALPALVLHEIPNITLNKQTYLLVLIAWLTMAFAAISVWALSLYQHWNRETTGALMLLVTLGNTGFVGIPLIQAHLGQHAVPYAILYDQLGTFLALNTFGIAVAAYFAKSQSQNISIWRNIIVFPPFIALLVAFLLVPFTYPTWFDTTLNQLASTLVPVVMVAVGLQWQLKLSSKDFSPLVAGLLLSLVITPIFTFGLVKAFGIVGLTAKVIVLEAAMPAMISAGVLAISHNLAPRFASALVGYSLTIALGSVWIWRLIVERVF